MPRIYRMILLPSLLILLSTSLVVHAQANITPKAADILYTGDAIPNDLLDVYVP